MIFCIRIKLRMNIHQVLFFCFLSALQDGDTGLTNAVSVFAGAEGGSGSINCYWTSSGNTKFFCKGECEEENILIKTDDVTAQSGRYSIEYKDGSSGRRIVSVTIKQLTKSDSGRYRCGLGGSYSEFDLIVTDEATLGVNTYFVRAVTEGESVRHGCLATVNGSRKFFCKGECKKEEDILVETEENKAQSGRYSIEYTKGSVFGLYVTITQLKKSDTGRYMCGYGRPSSSDSPYSFSIFVIYAPTTEEPNWIIPTLSFPETTEQFAAPTTEEPTSVPSASTPATTQSLTSSSGSFTPSSSFPETTEHFAELQDGNTGLSNAVSLYVGAEGGSGSMQCSLTSSGNTKFFCKGECKEENILIKTDDVTAQSGRYNIRYKDGSSGRSVTVAITQLTKSDSGRYRYGLGSLVPDDYCDFDLRVTDEATLGENTRFVRTITEGESVTHGCLATVYGRRKFFCKDECEKEEDILIETEGNRFESDRYTIEYIEGSGLYVTIRQLKQSDTGRYRCGYGRPSPDSPYSFSILVVDANSEVSHPGYFGPLVVCFLVIVVLVAVVLLFVYKLKMKKTFSLDIRETSDSRNKELSVHYENRPTGSMSEDHIYSALKETADM